MDYEYRSQYLFNIRIIRETLQEQINQRTQFNLTGFGFCPPNEQNENSSNLPSKIRIDLNDINGNGALAGSIGPRTQNESTNLTISSLDFSWPNGIKPPVDKSNPSSSPMVRTFNDHRHMSWVALHEVMHLLGFHHSEYWDQDMTDADVDTKTVIQVGSSLDPDSIMTRQARRSDTRGRALLSDRDVNCLNQIADRTILNQPQRPLIIDRRQQVRSIPESKSTNSTSTAQ